MTARTLGGVLLACVACALASLLTACGGADQGNLPSPTDGGAADADGGCPGAPPTLMCGYCGTTSPTTAFCGIRGWACPPPSAGCGFAVFPCGGEDSGVTCEVERDYCAVERFNPPSCQPLPVGCVPGSCACVDAGPPSICACSDDGGVTVACYPP
jgi:hypothetical protein